MKKIFSLIALATVMLWGGQVMAATTITSTYSGTYPINLDNFAGVRTTPEAGGWGGWTAGNEPGLTAKSDCYTFSDPSTKTTDGPNMSGGRVLSYRLPHCGQLTIKVSNGTAGRGLIITTSQPSVVVKSGGVSDNCTVKGGASCTEKTFDIDYNGSNGPIDIIITSPSVAEGCVTVTGSVYVTGIQFTAGPAAGPAVTASPTSLTTMSTVQGVAIDSANRALNIKGANLTGDVTLSIQAGGNGKFSVATATIAKADAVSANGRNVALTVDVSAVGTFKDTLLVASVGATTVKVPLQVVVDAPSAPVALTYTPANGATDVVSSGIVVSVGYDKPIKLGAVTPLVTCNNQEVEIDSVKVRQDTALQIYAVNFRGGSTYTFTVKAGAVTDAANNPTTADASWSFTIDGTAPTVTAKEPEGSSAPIKPIKITFSENVQKVAGYSITVNGGSVGYTLSGNTLTLKDTAIMPLRTYSVVIPKEAIIDMSGNELADSVKWTFTTATDAISFPYIPTLDANYIAPTWMSGAPYNATYAVTAECSSKTTTGAFRTNKVATPEDPVSFLTIQLPSCGLVKAGVSGSGGRTFIIRKLGGEALATKTVASNTCNTIEYEFKEFDPVTIQIGLSAGTGGGSIYSLEINAPVADKPVLSSSIPSNGAAQVATSTAITLTYDQSVQVVNASLIKINNVAVASAVANGAVVTLTPASALQGSTTYNITAPDSAIAAVVAAGAKGCPAVNISFSTGASGLVELPIIVENFQDWTAEGSDATACESVITFSSFSRDITLKLKSNAKVQANLKNVTVSPTCDVKTTPAAAGVSVGYVQLAKVGADEPGSDGTAGEFIVNQLSQYVTKVNFSISATGASRNTTLHKSTDNGVSWTQVGEYSSGVSGTAYSNIAINASNVMLKFVSGSSAPAVGDQRSRLHDLKVFGMIHPDSSNLPADPTSVSITSTTDTVYTNGTLQLTAVVLPSNASQEVIWSTSSARVTVSATGLVTPIAGASLGTATIDVKVKADNTIVSSKTIRLVQGGSTNAKKLNQASAGVYPNPVSGTLHVTSGETVVKVQVISATGVVLRTTNAAEVDMQGLAGGNYFVLVYTKEKKYPAVISIAKE